MGKAMMVSNSINKLRISRLTSKPLLANNIEVVKGLAKTPKRLLRTERRRAKAKLPLHYDDKVV